MKHRIVALVALALLATPIAHRVARELHATRVIGEVSELVAHPGDDGTTYEPVISYLHDGKRMDLRGGTSMSPPLYAEGEQIEVIYDGDDAAFGSPLARWWPWALAVATCLAVLFQVRIPSKLRPQLIGLAIVAGVLVIGAPDRAIARGALGIALTAVAGIVLVALSPLFGRERVQVPRAIATKRRSPEMPATFS